MAWHITGNSINIMEGRMEGGERKVGREGWVEGGRKKRRERMVRGKEERQKESKRQALRVLQQFCRRYQDMNIVHRRRKFESGVK